ncbi:MAG: Aminomethyltransferase [Pseudomonadota bacterium]|jgi:aminomethyltransferase
MTEPLKRTPLFHLHQELGARLVPYAGWEMPVQYSGVKAEHLAVRQHAGVFDVSHMGELFIRGEGSLEAVNRLITNDLAKVVDGRALYTCCCNERGTILDDLIVYRLSAAEILVVCNASNLDKIAQHFRTEIQGQSVTDESDAISLIAFQGPRALPLLERVLNTAVASTLKPFGIADAAFEGHSLRVARTGYTGEDGVEIFCPNASAEALFRRLLEVDAGGGVLPAGLAARDTLRLEARLALYGNDISEDTNPLEAGLGWTVKFEKAQFVGKAALLEIRKAAPRRTFVGFEMTGRGIARQGYPLLNNTNEVVGECTSGAPSPTLGSSIGLGYLPTSMAAIGTEFLVDCRGRAVTAKVVKTPFYKRAN